MTDHVRVRDKETGHEFTVPTDRYESASDLFTKLDKPATSSTGEPLPTKYKTTVAKSAADNRTAKSVTEKENI